MRVTTQAFAPVRGTASKRAASGRAWVRARKLLSLLALLPIPAMLLSCHKAAAPTSPITITVSPTGTSLNISMTTTFSATVGGGTTDKVTWDVNGLAANMDGTSGSLTTVGTVIVKGSGNPTGDGLGHLISSTTYAAPTNLPAPSTVTITATSTDDTTVSASATLTLLPAATVTVSPQPAVPLAPGAQLQFTATVAPAPNSNVNWEVNGLPGGFSTIGLISNTGLYTAPLSPPPGGSVTITAVSVADTTQSGNATVTLTFGTASFQGPYAFTLKGKNASGTFSRAGSFTADGNGGIVGGLEDVVGSSGITSNISFVGTYTVGTDGRGTLTFSDGLLPSIFRIVMPSHNQAQIISYDTLGTAVGQADLQLIASFKPSALLGTYVFDFAGLDSSGKPISEVGVLVADGQGGIHTGLVDINDNGVISSNVAFTGTYTVSGNGRGTAQIVTGSGTFNFILYIVSAGSAKFVSADTSPAPAVAGVLSQQSPGAVFTQSSLNGNYGFLIGGANSAGNIATVGSFSTTGNNILTGGVLDENKAGVLTLDQLFTGTYLMDNTGTGRGTASFSAPSRTYTFVFYLDGQGGAVFQETDTAITSDGLLAQQQNAPLLTGSYALNWGGAAAATTQEFTGQVTLNAGGTITSGHQDFSSYPGAGAPTETLTGNLVTGVNARDTLTLIPALPALDNRSFVLYVISPTRMFALETDAGALTAGTLLKQF